MDVLGSLADEDRFVASIRKGDPVAAFFYGLGFAASSMLPGRSGCFLLTAAEVAACSPAVEAALTLDAPGRARVLDRISAWFAAVGDAGSSFEAEELIGGPRRILQRASEQGQGALGIMCWY